MAPVIARLVVSLKFMLGLFLILNINPKNLIPKLLLPIIALHIYDIIWGFTASNIIMHYSYTEVIRLNVLSGIVATALLLVFAVFMLLKPAPSDIRFWWVKYPLGLTALVLPFILNAIFIEDLQDGAAYTNEQFNLEAVGSAELDSLAKGELIVGFFSTSCPYCVNAARKIAISQKRWDSFPNFYICFLGQQGAAQHFLEVAHVQFPYQYLDREHYYQLSDGYFPKFAWVENSTIKKRWDGQTFNYYTMNKLSSGQE